MNQAFQYQRLVLGYHGCDKSVADRVLAGNETLRKSEKPYNWLGHGIYFWEHGPERAFEWAEESRLRLVSGVLIEISETWETGKAYLSLNKQKTNLKTQNQPPSEKIISHFYRKKLRYPILNEGIKAVHLALIHPIPNRCVFGLNPRSKTEKIACGF